jgi:hypothetical protein
MEYRRRACASTSEDVGEEPYRPHDHKCAGRGENGLFGLHDLLSGKRGTRDSGIVISRFWMNAEASLSAHIQEFRALHVGIWPYFFVCVERCISEGWQTASMRTHPPSLANAPPVQER